MGLGEAKGKRMNMGGGGRGEGGYNPTMELNPMRGL